VSQPSIKKNPDGTWKIEGVQERNISQLQSDYQEIVKASQLITGEQGETARRLIVNNPEMSGGLLSSLSSYGAVPNNDLVKTLVDIDKQTRAQRELDAFQEAQRLANERFEATTRGKIWKVVKGFVRGVALVGAAPFEAGIGLARQARGNLPEAFKFGESKPLLSLGDWKGAVEQTTLYQTAKDLIDDGKIDLGAGFFPSEETGAGFAARRAKLDAQAVNVKIGNKTYQRPWSIFDPVVTVITGGTDSPTETVFREVVTAVGDLLVGIKTDTFVMYGKLRSRINELDRVARTSSGMKSAKAYQEKALLEAQLEEGMARVNQAKAEMDAAVGPARTVKEAEWNKALDEQLKISDDYDNLVYDKEKVAGFLGGPMAAPAIDAIAEMGDWKQIWRLGKQRGGRGGFNVEQSKALAQASTREEVLDVLAGYIAQGKVAADALESGTATGKVVRQILNSRIIPGSAAQVVNSVKGLGARGLRKLPWYDKVVKAYSTITPQGKAIHSSDKDALIDAIYSYGRVTNVPESKLDELADIVAMTDDASEAGFTASGKLFDEIYKANVNNPGINKELLEKVTRIFQNSTSKMGSYWAQRHAAGAKLDYIMSGGKRVTLTGPHLDSEYLNSVVYFPDARELLDAISFVNKIKFAGKTAEQVKESLDIATNVIWKRIVLVRPAYILRNIAEEQIRVLGTGHISFFNNPIMAMGMWLGRDGGPKWREVLNKFDSFKHTITDESFKLTSAADEFLAEELAHDLSESYIKFMTNRSASGVDNDIKTAMTFAGFIPREFGHPRWFEGLANEIRILSNSIAGRAVARTGPTVDNQLATVDFLLTGAGKDEWVQFARQQKPEIRDWLLSKEGAMAYLFTGTDGKGRAVSLLARIEEATGRGGEGSQALKNLIAYGKIEGPGFKVEVPKGKQSAENSIRNAAAISEGRKALKDANQEFADILKQNFDGKGNWEGILMNIPETEYKTLGKKRGLLTRISDGFFDFAVKLEKTSTMGPEWRQSYWDAIYSISGALDADAVAKLSSVAKKSLTPLKSWKGEPIGSQHAVWKSFKNAKGDGNITAQEAHEYASMVASKRVADLFYDASRKRLLFHQLRLIAPFANAWEDTIRKWSTIALDNPLQVYKIQKGLQWLTKPESSALYQLTDAKDFYDPNQGFFFTDPLDGQRKFFIPFLGTGLNFMSNLFGKGDVSAQGPYAIAATPQSLNFAFASGSIMPGFGPGIQIGLKVLDNLGINPINIAPIGMRDGISQLIFPFGEPDLRQGVIEGFLPGNWRRIISALGKQEEAYAAAFAPVMNYLASGGNYNLNDLEDQGQLIRDTNKFAQWFTLFRGIFGMVSPFPLNLQGMTTLDDGNVVLSTALYNDFKQLELQSGGNYNKAYADFMDLYGPETIFAIINTSSGAPTNLMTYELIQRSPEVIDLYADTYGYAYPDGGFSQELYRWQRRAGEKEKFTSEQLVQRATSLRFYAADDRLMTRLVSGDLSEEEYEEARKSLRNTYIKAGLKFESDPYKNARVKEQLRRMAQDPRFADSDAVAGLRDYLYLRDAALKAAGITNDSLKKEGALAQREWLADKVKGILQRNPEFYKFYYRFFKDELEG
jgi:hypothetical protein